MEAADVTDEKKEVMTKDAKVIKAAHAFTLFCCINAFTSLK
ncbi:hypothetical protein [Paenibacillus aquistagni]|nr:hypothetical protein [Paenibacillus aquistagni]